MNGHEQVNPDGAGGSEVGSDANWPEFSTRKGGGYSRSVWQFGSRRADKR